MTTYWVPQMSLPDPRTISNLSPSALRVIKVLESRLTQLRAVEASRRNNQSRPSIQSGFPLHHLSQVVPPSLVTWQPQAPRNFLNACAPQATATRAPLVALQAPAMAPINSVTQVSHHSIMPVEASHIPTPSQVNDVSSAMDFGSDDEIRPHIWSSRSQQNSFNAELQSLLNSSRPPTPARFVAKPSCQWAPNLEPEEQRAVLRTTSELDQQNCSVNIDDSGHFPRSPTPENPAAPELAEASNSTCEMKETNKSPSPLEFIDLTEDVSMEGQSSPLLQSVFEFGDVENAPSPSPVLEQTPKQTQVLKLSPEPALIESTCAKSASTENQSDNYELEKFIEDLTHVATPKTKKGKKSADTKKPKKEKNESRTSAKSTTKPSHKRRQEEVVREVLQAESALVHQPNQGTGCPKRKGPDDPPKTEFQKKKKKFQTPFLSQNSQNIPTAENKSKPPESGLSYKNLNLQDMELLVETLKDKPPIEVSMTMLYRDGSCQLSKSATEFTTSSASGLMLAVLEDSKPVNFYHLSLTNPRYMGQAYLNQARALTLQLLQTPSRKICFKAQSLFTYIIEIFNFTYEEVSLKWTVIDPLLGCWLIDPDSPATDFRQILRTLNTTLEGMSESNSKDKVCKYLTGLSEVTRSMYGQLTNRGLWRVFADLEMGVASILSAMEITGLSVDLQFLREVGSQLDTRIKQLQSKANAVMGGYVALSSPLQLRRILFEQLKLDTKLKNPLKGEAKSTSEPILNLLRHLHPLPGLILEFRHLQKIKSTYVDGIISHVKAGHIRTSWDQMSAATGRVVSRNPNLQSIPKQPVTIFQDETKTEVCLRTAYKSKPGYTFLGADFQHIELRLLAHFAEDPVLLEIFTNSDQDVFAALAKQWLGNSESEEVSREQTKRVVYAVMYGAGVAKLEQVLQVDELEAKRIYASFAVKFPQMKNFTQRVIQRARDQGYLTTLSGRRRLFPQINSQDSKLRTHAERQAVNFLFQGSTADVCKAAMVTTEQAQQQASDGPLGAQMVLQIHDELVWEVPDENLEQFGKLVQQVMEATRSKYNIKIPLKVKLSSGKTWADLQ